MTELTRKGVCEQAEHVMLPQGIRRMMKNRTNQPMQKYRCSYKAFEWSKHSQKRLWVSNNMKAEKCTTLIHESSAFQLFIFHI